MPAADSPTEAAVPADLVAAWAAAEAAWSEPAAHDRVASVALSHAAMAWLAGRYRAVARARPDDAIAAARLERIGAMSIAALHATAAVPPSPRGKSNLAYLVLLVLALGVAIVLLAAKLSSRQRSGTGARRPAIPGRGSLVHPRQPAAPTGASAPSGSGPTAPAPFVPAPGGR